MIEKMQMVHIVTTADRKQEMLESLRSVGILHPAEKKSADRSFTDRVADLSKAEMTLKEYKGKKASPREVLSDEDFSEMFDDVQQTLQRRTDFVQDAQNAASELERIADWGDFLPDDLEAVKEAGLDLHFYTIGKNELQMAEEDENVKFIRLCPVKKTDAIAVIGKLPPSINATEFSLPEKSADEYRKIIKDSEAGIAACSEKLKEYSEYEGSFKDQLIKARNDESFSSVSETFGSDDALVWLSGYVPEADMDRFKAMAEESGCAWAVEDVSDEDSQVPTKVRYSKVSRLIKPIFDLLGILPGYREQDVSLFFLLFFALFVAMIIGDAGYGSLILIGTAAYAIKTKTKNDAVFLLTVLSITTIIWGAITGNWFGAEGVMKIPFLKALVIPSFANYPEYYGLTAAQQQNVIMKFSFSLGAVQMALGAILSIRKKLSEKDLSWVADLGWMIAIIGMYLLSLYLVIGENISMTPVAVIIGAAFVLVVLFGGMAPGVSFGDGLKAGLGGAFTVFLDTISCFGNIMSYIRLFAVGMAGLAIAQSFNSIGSGFSGVLVVIGAVVVVIGHVLNIIMSLLSVIVHGVRLNVMEFSGQAGLEWTGIAYEPFELKTK